LDNPLKVLSNQQGVEKSGDLGGALKFAGHVDFKADLKKFCDVLIQRVKNRGIRVMYNTEVTPDTVKEIGPDHLIIAAGAEPIIPRIPGFENKKVVMAVNMLDEGVRGGSEERLNKALTEPPFL